jgi:hypothetical protein
MSEAGTYEVALTRREGEEFDSWTEVVYAVSIADAREQALRLNRYVVGLMVSGIFKLAGE